MKPITILIFLILTSCSLNPDSKYWTENTDKTKINKKKLQQILKKAHDLSSMTFDEYKIYVDDFTKKSKYPDINK